jgi:O-antigen ligase/polysaccharide polymerase Wzy-like membrane protein
MMASALEVVGLLAACGGAAVALTAGQPRLRYAAAAIALIAAPVLVAGDVWDSSRFVDLREHPVTLAAVIVLAALAVGVAVLAFTRLPWAFPVAVFAALPLRVPLHLGGETSHLLVPLYVVIAGGVIRFGYLALSGDRARGSAGGLSGQPSGPSLAGWPAALWLYRVLAATLVLYAIQAIYSLDVSNAIENASFFLVPFAVMLVLLGEVRWTPRILRGVLIAAAAMGLIFAGVAFYEYAARDLLLSRGDLLQSNQLHLYFRVNSLFYDPNVFGRYLALTLIALGAYLAWSDGSRLPILAAIVSGVLLGALTITYSISSFAALIAGLLVVVGLRWGVRRGVAAGAAILVCGAIFLVATGTGRENVSSNDSSSTTTSGRVNLVSGGLELAGDRPAWGWGSGSFGAAFARHIERAKTTVSHTEPITVAAEQGAIGLLVYLALVVLAGLVLLSGAGTSAATAAVGACFVAMVVHSLGYAAFTIDPAIWALLGVGVGLPRGRVRASSTARVGALGDSEPRRSDRDPRPAAI